ncbi:hypothetical protein [Thermococcus sp.]|uniref:hypothetical protein n=1 Tax=Thermococcus sp. TaxID=35749 RepID=UPI0025CD66F0|nr:hypothetical protein [Thermococcus sp.]
MNGDGRVFRNYLIFTIPQVTVFVGAVLGILLAVGVNLNTALGIFSMLYGAMLMILTLIIRPHVSGLFLYKLVAALSVGLILIGVLVLIGG